jgi:hypothetical protein
MSWKDILNVQDFGELHLRPKQTAHYVRSKVGESFGNAVLTDARKSIM